MRKQFAVSFITLMTAFTGVNAAAEDADTTKAEIKIAAQPLDRALSQLGQQFDTQIVVFADDASNLTAKSVEGQFTESEALNFLLNGSGLEYRRVNDRMIAVGTPDRLAANYAQQEEVSSFRVAQLDQEDDVRDVEQVSDERDEEEEKDVIVVTGTNIRGIEDGPSPVLAFDRDDIDVAGVGTLREFFATIPQNFGGGANTGNQVRSAGDGSTTSNGFGSEVNLRGLGTGTTLTLLNGRRLTTSEQASFVDITAIPPSAIERIEVLTDGASAIYGSDAIGGVVNIILRDDFEGFETRARYGTATRGEPDEFGFSQAAGANWDSGRVFLSADFFNQNTLSASDRTFSENADFLPTDLIPESERLSFFASASQEIGDKVEFSVDGFYSRRDSDFIITSVSGTNRFAPRTELYGGTFNGTFELIKGWQGDGTVGISESKLNSSTSRIVGGAVTNTTNSENSTRTWFTDIKLEGPLASLPGGMARMAVGGSFRQIDFETLTSNFDRDIWAGFAELYVPVIGEGNRRPGIERFDITAALRYDEYSDFGSTTNPKFGALWEIIPGLLVRGTYGTSFRAPNLTDLDGSGAVVAVGNLTADLTNFTNRIPTIWFSGGNADLQPEEATTWTTGVEWSPPSIDGLNVELTYYDIDYDGRIRSVSDLLAVAANEDGVFDPIINTNPSADEIDRVIALAAGGTFGAPIFITAGPFGLPAGFDPADAERLFDLRLNNVAVTQQNGIDFSISYSLDVGDGDVRFGLNGDYILNSIDRFTSTAPETDNLNDVFKPVDLTLRGSVAYSNGPFKSSVFVNYVSDYVNDLSDPEQTLPSWTTFDVSMSYDFESADFWLVSDLKLSASVRNIFDEDPPFVDVGVGRGTGFDPTNANPLGRFVSFSITKAW